MVLESGLAQFRSRHPMGAVVTELLQAEQGLYFVRAQVIVDKHTVATGLAAAETVESAEDSAILRALKLGGFIKEAAVLSVPIAPVVAQVQPLLPPVEERRNGNGNGNGHAAPPLPNFAAYEPDEEDFVDLSELIAATDVELKRIGWDNQQGKAHLSRTYGKGARKQLTEDELQDFLNFLKKQPSYRRSPVIQETPF